VKMKLQTANRVTVMAMAKDHIVMYSNQAYSINTVRTVAKSFRHGQHVSPFYWLYYVASKTNSGR